MLISEKIFLRLKEMGMSQKDFSRATGIAESTISDWKKKKLNPTSEKLPAICQALGMSADELLGITDNVFSTNNCSDVDLQVTKNLTMRLRKLARLNRIKLDESEHQSSLNQHLFKYFEFIGVDKLIFIKDYLCHIQPFMITEIKSQEKFDNAICVIDEYYRIALYIKVDATKGEEVIVSFHENNKNGIARRTPLINRMSDVYVLPDSIGSHIVGTDNYTVNLFITRGVRTFPINVPAIKYDADGFMVNYRYINNELVDIVNRYLEDLYTSDLDLNSIELFPSLQQLSFTSYGNDVFSNISMLIDSLIIQKDAISRQISDSALCIYCNSVELTELEKSELLDTLTQRFAVNSVRILPEILNRISMNL